MENEKSVEDLTLREVSSHHEELLKKCKTACLTLKRRFENELDPTIQQLLEDAKPSQPQATHRTAFGIVLKGCHVESCVPGTPASKIFNPGDEIIAVDGFGVDSYNCAEALIGSDIPGSMATISYIAYNKPRPSVYEINDRVLGRHHDPHPINVQLRRLPKDILNRRSIMSEYLRSLRELAFEHNDAASLQIVPKVKELWEQTLPSEAELERQGLVVEDACSILTLSASVVTELVSTVAQLEAAPGMQELVKEHESLQQEVPELKKEIEELKRKVQVLERLPEVDAKLDQLLQDEVVADPQVLTASFEFIDRLKRKADKGIASKEREKLAKAQLGQELSEAYQEIARLKKVVETLQDSNMPLLADIEHLNKLLADTRSDLAASQTKEKAGSERIAKLVGDVQDLRRQMSQVTQSKDERITAQKEEMVQLQREVRDLEDAAESAVVRHSAEMEELREEIKVLKERLSESNGEVLSLNKRLHQSVQDLGELVRKSDEQRDQLKTQVEEAKRLLAAATARAEEAERTIKTLLANKATADVAAAAMDVANQELKDKLAASDKTLRDTRATCDGEVQAAQGQLSLEKRLVDELKQQLLTATQDLRQHVVDLEAKLAASVQRAADAEREKNKVWEDAQKLHAVIKTRDEEIAELKKRIDALQKQLQEAQDRLAAGSDGHAHLLKQIQVLETEKNALQLAVDMAKDQAASAAAAAQVKLADKDALVLELKREMGDVQRELQTAEAACKIEIAKLADKDTEIAALKKKLQQKEKAMADQVKKLADAEAQMQALNKTHAAALEALRDEIEAGVGRESSLKADWQISQKELIAAKKELDLALQSHHATRLQLDSDITQLKESLATQIEHAQEEEKLKKHWMSEKLSVDAALAEKVKEMQALQHSMAQLQQQIFDLNAALAQHKKQLESATESLEQLQQAKLEWEKTEALLLWQIEEVKKQLSKEEANHKSLMMPVDEKMAELRKWLDEALAHNTKLSLEKQQAEADEHATNQRLDAMSKAEADLRTRVIPRLDNTIAELQASVRTKDEEIAELKRQLQTVITESGNQIAELEKVVSRDTATIEKLKKQILTSDLKIQELQDKLAQQTEKFREQQQRAEAAEFDCAAHIQTIQSLNAQVKDLKYALDVANKALEELEAKERQANALLQKLQLEHAQCYKPKQCGIGLKLVDATDASGKAVVKLSYSVLGGSFWREQINNPSFRARAGDTLVAIDGLPVFSSEGIPTMIKGLEDTTVDLTIKDKHGIHHCTLTRRVNHILHPEKAWRVMQDLIKMRVDGGVLKPYPAADSAPAPAPASSPGKVLEGIPEDGVNSLTEDAR